MGEVGGGGQRTSARFHAPFRNGREQARTALLSCPLMVLLKFLQLLRLLFLLVLRFTAATLASITNGKLLIFFTRQLTCQRRERSFFKL
jgi:hypothetical protein